MSACLSVRHEHLPPKISGLLIYTPHNTTPTFPKGFGSPGAVVAAGTVGVGTVQGLGVLGIEGRGISCTTCIFYGFIDSMLARYVFGV